jgi:hypothetical protein
MAERHPSVTADFCNKIRQKATFETRKTANLGELNEATYEKNDVLVTRPLCSLTVVASPVRLFSPRLRPTRVSDDPSATALSHPVNIHAMIGAFATAFIAFSNAEIESFDIFTLG